MVNSGEKLSIVCSGKAAGGEYDVIEVAGSGTITGDVAFNRMSIAGSGKVDGNAKGENIKIAGSLSITGEVDCSNASVAGSWRVEGDAEVRDFTINGSIKFLQNLRANNIKIYGSANVDGNINADSLKILGTVKTNKSCECNDFKAYGSFEIAELLNAENIIINPSGRCYVKEIGGTTIEVSQKAKEDNMGSAVNVFGDIVNFFKDVVGSNTGRWGTLECDTIEGDDITLENTIAKVVRGNMVYIGEGCTVDLVEYKTGISKHPRAVVKEERKI